MTALLILLSIVLISIVYIVKSVKDGSINDVREDVMFEIEKEEELIKSEENRLNESMKQIALETKLAMKQALGRV